MQWKLTWVGKFYRDCVAIDVKQCPQGPNHGDSTEEESLLNPIDAIFDITCPCDVKKEQIGWFSVSLSKSFGPVARHVCEVRASIAREVGTVQCSRVNICETKSKHSTPAAAGLHESDVNPLVNGNRSVTETDSFAERISPWSSALVITKNNILPMYFVEQQWEITLRAIGNWKKKKRKKNVQFKYNKKTFIGFFFKSLLYSRR